MGPDASTSSPELTCFYLLCCLLVAYCFSCLPTSHNTSSWSLVLAGQCTSMCEWRGTISNGINEVYVFFRTREYDTTATRPCIQGGERKGTSVTLTRHRVGYKYIMCPSPTTLCIKYVFQVIPCVASVRGWVAATYTGSWDFQVRVNESSTCSQGLSNA